MEKQNLNLMKGVLLAFLWTFSLCMFGQNITVTGTVTDTNGEPLIGVTIQVQGTTNGTVTDMDGNFTLSDVAPDGILEISYVGMESQEIAIDGQTNIQVTLSEDTEILEEVVVVGYGTMDRREVTSAIKTVSARDFNPGGCAQSSGSDPGKSGRVEHDPNARS